MTKSCLFSGIFWSVSIENLNQHEIIFRKSTYMPVFQDILKFQYFCYLACSNILARAWLQSATNVITQFFVSSVQLQPIGTILTGSDIVLGIYLN